MRNRLLQIDRELGRRAAPQRRERIARAYDARRPIALRYSPAFHVPAPLPPAPPARATSLAGAVALSTVATARRCPRPDVPEGSDATRAATGAFAMSDDERSQAPDAGEFLARVQREQGVRSVERPAGDEDEGQSAPPPAAPSGNVFDTLTYANAFDAGPMEVDFSVFDRALDEADRAERARTAARRDIFENTPRIDEMDLVADLAGLDEAAAQAAPASFDIRYDVPLVPQQTGMSCWAAGAAMLVAWRDKVSVDPSEIARAVGYWRQYQGGLAAEDTTMFDGWGMTAEPAQSYAVAGFRSLLELYGPLWVASAEPGPHIRVVTAMYGDGTPAGTYIEINDPWESGMASFRLPNAGAQYREAYADFVAKQESLARTESRVPGVYVAHLRERRGAQ